jgi:acetolactate synthase-1/2/3 large subunit
VLGPAARRLGAGARRARRRRVPGLGRGGGGRLSDADGIAAALAAAGTQVCFGVPGGGANLDLAGACGRHGIRFVLTHGETAAVIAAGVWGELTGTPGLALCTRGPGLAAAVNGIAQAHLDRQPVVVVADGAGFTHPHQRIDHAALVAPVAKGTVTDPGDAVRLALAPPWGPVLLDAGGPPQPPVVLPATPPSAAVELPAARRPVVVAGVGVRGAEPALRALARETGVPVLTTYKAKGAIPESWPNAAGILTGGTIEAPLLQDADLILAVGLDPVELIPAPWPYAAPIVSLTPWPLPAGPLSLAAGHVGPLDRLLAGLRLDGSGWQRPGSAYAADARARLAAADDGPGLTPHAVVHAVARALGPEAIATVDAGAHMLVAMPVLQVEEPSRCLISSGLATMGFSLPAAIAASLVTDAPVLCLTGDGGLGMCLAELETAARLGRDVRVVVFDDATLSLIAIKQGDGQGGDDAVRYRAGELAAVARGLGLPATTVHDVAALDEALARRGPSLIAARIDPAGYRAVLAATRA